MLNIDDRKHVQLGISKIVAVLNGAPRSPHVQHVEIGCCPDDRQEIIDKCVAAIGGECGLLLAGEGEQMSNTVLGGYCTEHLGRQCGGHMFHNMLHRTLVATSPRRAPPACPGEPLQDADDYRKMFRSKAWRATHSFGDESPSGVCS